MQRIKSRREPVKLRTMTDSIAWHDEAGILASYGEGKLLIWTYPRAAFLDRDLLPQTVEVHDGKAFGKAYRKTGVQIIDFSLSTVSLRMVDGSRKVKQTSPFSPVLHKFVSRGEWEEAVRLCRLVRSKLLWTTLAEAAMESRHLETAEVAFSAIEDVARLSFVLYVKDISSETRVNAELSEYAGDLDEAESILLQSSPPMVYRAIKMNLRMFRWERALQIAVQHRQHIDVALWYRNEYNQKYGKKETSEMFKKVRFVCEGGGGGGEEEEEEEEKTTRSTDNLNLTKTPNKTQYAAEVTVDAEKVAEAKRKARAIEGGDEDDEDDDEDGEQKH